MVKKGYKQTEVGEIPEHWKISSLATAFQRLETGVSVNSDDSLSSEYHILKTSAVHDGVVDTAETKPVIPRDYPRLKCPLVKGSIIISRMNTPALVGECGFAKDTKAGTYLPDRLWQIQNHNTGSFDFVWLNYLLNSKQYRDAVRATATGTSNSMKNISKERLLDIRIPHPPISEQADIAVALLEVDELINLIEKQISKKKAIKQGAMQVLLTGKKRLPGFSADWKVCRLEVIADFSTTTISTKRFDNRFYVGTDNLIADKGGVKINTLPLIYPNVREYLEGDILLSNIRPYLKKIWYATRDGGCSNDVLVIRRKDGYALGSKFLYYLLSDDAFFDEIVANAVGTKMPRGDKAVMKSFTLNFPSDVEEQKAIISTLSDMDAEIEALEQKLAKYRQLKQGMMQQLLTGKIRLV